jgi:hypothetical protein
MAPVMARNAPQIGPQSGPTMGPIMGNGVASYRIARSIDAGIVVVRKCVAPYVRVVVWFL